MLSAVKFAGNSEVSYIVKKKIQRSNITKINSTTYMQALNIFTAAFIVNRRGKLRHCRVVITKIAKLAQNFIEKSRHSLLSRKIEKVVIQIPYFLKSMNINLVMVLTERQQN